MVDAFCNSFLIVVLPLYIAKGGVTGSAFGLTESLVTGLILSVFGFLNSTIQPITGRLSDTTGKRKPFILVGLAVLAVANFAYSWAESYPSLLAIRALQGIGVAFTVTATVALVNELATAETRGGDMGVFNVFRLIGYGLGPLIAGAVVSNESYAVPLVGVTLSGFDAAFFIPALGAIVSAFIVSVFVSDPETISPSSDSGFALSVFADDDSLLDPLFTLGLASLFVATGMALFSTIQPVINDHLSQNAALFGVEFAAFTVAELITQIPVGRASDRYGRRPFIIGGFLLFAPVTFLQGFVTAPWQMIAARFAQGAAAAMVFAPALALAGDLAAKGESGTKLSILTMSFGLGTAIGPLASGFLIRYGYAVPFAFGGIVSALGAVLVYTQVEETRTGAPRELDHLLTRFEELFSTTLGGSSDE